MLLVTGTLFAIFWKLEQQLVIWSNFKLSSIMRNVRLFGNQQLLLMNCSNSTTVSKINIDFKLTIRYQIFKCTQQIENILSSLADNFIERFFHRIISDWKQFSLMRFFNFCILGSDMHVLCRWFNLSSKKLKFVFPKKLQGRQQKM